MTLLRVGLQITERQRLSYVLKRIVIQRFSVSFGLGIQRQAELVIVNVTRGFDTRSFGARRKDRFVTVILTRNALVGCTSARDLFIAVLVA